MRQAISKALGPVGQALEWAAGLGLRLWRRLPLWIRIPFVLLSLYWLAYTVHGWFPLSDYTRAGRIARAAFWPAEQARNFLGLGARDSADLSVVSVAAWIVAPEEIVPKITSVGFIEHFEKVEVNARTPGRIDAFFVREGQTVDRGQKIAQLERAFLELELRQQQAALDAARSEMGLTQEKYQNARKAAEARFQEIEKQLTQVKKLRADLDRVRTTYSGKTLLFAEGGISREELAEMKNEVIAREAAYRMAQKDLEIVSVGYRDEDIRQKEQQIPADPAAKRTLLIDMNSAVPKAEVEVARSRVKSAEAAMLTTSALLKETTIIAPISGLVASRNKSVGEQVTGGSVSTPSQAIMVLVDIRQVYGVMTVKESDLKTLKQGMKMNFSADPYPDMKFHGTIEIISPIVDSRTHTVEVKALLPNPGLKLRPGMFIRASIVSGQAERMIVLPQTSIVPLEEQKGYVFLIRDGLIYRAEVELGRQIDERIEIKSGLKAGDIVATDKLNQLRESMKVTPVLPKAQ